MDTIIKAAIPAGLCTMAQEMSLGEQNMIMAIPHMKPKSESLMERQT